MSIESPVLSVDRLFRDEDKTLRFYVTTGLPIEVVETVDDGDVTILVKPLSEALSNGDKIRFGNVVATLSAAADAGDTSITITAITGNLPRGSIGYEVQDVTGWTFEFWVRASPASVTNLFTAVPSINSAANGIVDAVIADTDTSLLTAGEYYYRLRRTNAGNEAVLAFGAFHLRA